VKIGAKIVHHGRSIAFQMAEFMVPRALFQQVLGAIAALRPSPPPDSDAQTVSRRAASRCRLTGRDSLSDGDHRPVRQDAGAIPSLFPL